MSILYISKKRFTDPNERVGDKAMDLLGQARAIVEPETIGQDALVSDDVIDIISAISPGTVVSYSKIADQTVTASGSLLFTDSPIAPAGTTADTVVVVEQNNTSLYIGSYIETALSTSGDYEYHVRFVAHNHTASPVTFSNATTIEYIVFTGEPQAQPNTPNAELTVEQSLAWLDDDGVPIGNQMNVHNLNATARPSVTIPDDCITEIELNSRDLQKMAALYTGDRTLFVVPSDTSIPAGTAITLGTVTLTGTVARCSQVGVVPLFTAKNAAGTVTIQARNNTFATLQVDQGTQLNVVAF